jgi:hypothetical protein
MRAKTIANRLERLRVDAEEAGFALVVDSDAMAVRVMTEAQARKGDLRTLGIAVRLHNACGSAVAKVSGSAVNYGNL